MKEWQWKNLQQGALQTPSPRQWTCAQTACKPHYQWGMIKLNQFASLISLLGCPQCTKPHLKCKHWQERNGSFTTTIQCTYCSSFHHFTSTTRLPSNHYQHDAPTLLILAWGLQGLGYERLELVWGLAGRIPPISRAAYAQLMKSVVLSSVLECMCVCVSLYQLM